MPFISCCCSCSCTQTLSMKKRLTSYVFAYIYKLLYTYVYPYNHTNMFLGCAGRGSTHWYRFGGPRGLRNTENLEVSTNPPLAIYCYLKPNLGLKRQCIYTIDMF